MCVCSVSAKNIKYQISGARPGFQYHIDAIASIITTLMYHKYNLHMNEQSK